MDLNQKLEIDKIVAYTERFCMSEMGRDALRDQPNINDYDKLQEELNKVQDCKALLAAEEDLPIEILPDTRPILSKLNVEAHFLQPKELLSVSAGLKAASQIKRFVFNRKEIYPFLNSLTETIWFEKTLQYEIRQLVEDNGEIKTTASDALAYIRGKLQRSREALRRKMESLQRKYAEDNLLMDDGVTIRNSRLVLGFRVEYKYKIQGFIHDISQSGQTVFIEPSETLAINNEIRDLEIQEVREIERLLREMSHALQKELPNLRLNQDILMQFDAIYAKAKLALAMDCVLPNISRENTLKLYDAYHLWLLISNTKHHKQTIPLTVEMDSQKRVLVITGPNAGGKSVAMKTLGLLAGLLKQVFLIPCREDSVIPLFDNIYVEIGDEQSIENDLSTFSSHLTNIKHILDEASAQSLVLIDEICSGTDPEEGGALATAILESFLKRKALVCVTTHQGSLKAFAHEREGIMNGSMQYDAYDLRPTYQFIAGLPGNSFALEMARRMQYPPQLLKHAKTLIGENRQNLEQLISDLSREFQSVEKDRLNVRQLIKENEKLKDELKQKVTEAEKQRKEIKKKGIQENKHVLAQADKLVKNLLEEIKSSEAKQDTAKKSRKIIEKKRLEMAKEESKLLDELVASQSISQFEPGDQVTLLDSSTKGVIKDIHGEEASVEFGQFRMKTQLRNLRKVGGKTEPESQSASVSVSVKRDVDYTTVSHQLDLRGQTGDEALYEIDRFFEKALSCHLNQVEIIHGKGTGALRKKVNEALKRDVRVGSFRLGNLNEGGVGVTIVNLKA